MKSQNRKCKENQRNKLIRKLIALNIYNKEDMRLYELPLIDLRYEYKNHLASFHPHGEMESIQWNINHQKRAN